MLREYYYRLEELAEKNQVDKESEFKDAALLLSNAKRMIDEGNFEGAGRNLQRVYAQLEAIRAGLVSERESENLASHANATSLEDEELARKLSKAADRFERNALELLNQTGSNTQVQAKLQEALSLIVGARASIEAQDLESAKGALSAALDIIGDVKDSIKDDRDDGSGNTSAQNSSEESGDDSRGSSNDNSDDSDSGSEEEDKEDDKGSSSGSIEDEDDQ
jgi:flagellin-specific chaperone FliS